MENKHSLPSRTLTVSVGLTTITPNSDFTCAHLIKEADDLLYKAKNKGKDALCVSDLAFI
ncbi:diguanylate cyclase domain-containing protein [Pseudoalteromonas carrageenovora]|uniref:diguanylate cyclase domain-containing protein n=1 Tax=Pseudoalteromonas carrageenovora TaxID=227 RepID=UPI00349FB705